MTRVVLLLLAFACVMPGLACAAVSFGDYERFEFAPARSQTFTIPVRLDQPAAVTIEIYTPDGDRVRTLRGQKPLPPGAHMLVWDGKDAEGTVVPDEAYIPVLTATLADGTAHTVDPRTTGGEVVEDLRVTITPAGDIAYHLSAPSRVLIRVGIKGGPMLRAPANWEPRGPGKNIQRWDGRDQDGLVTIRGEENLGLLVTAFRLPEYAIITTGNTVTDYRTYRQRQDWPDRVVPPEERVLAREGARIAKQYYQPRDQLAEPRVTLTLPGDLPRSAAGLPRVQPGQSVAVRTDVPREDRWLMNESLYEVGFFVDHVFVAEEEQGYVPLTWRWQVPDLAPGRHLLTVNISGFGGKVGVASLLFEVAREKKETP